MLSRLAESFFWIGRYVERAESTTRLLQEHHQLLVEDRTVSEGAGTAIVLEALSMPHAHVSTRAQFIDAVVGTEAEASTVMGAVFAARENARAVREVLAGEVFESLNSTYLLLNRRNVPSQNPGASLHQILERLLVVNGSFEWEMSRDESYLFWTIGRALERIDMTARLLNLRHEELWFEAGPTTTLRAAAAVTPFLRTGYALVPDEVRAFLVLNGEFPRSMLRSAATAEEAVRGLERQGVTGSEELLREIGRMHSALEFADRDADRTIINSLIEQTQQSAARASELASEAFFRQTGTIVWSH
jgi:uncharacterized alpha-E superfamily protein